MRSLALLTAFGVVHLIQAATIPGASPTVKIASGVVVGTATVVPSATQSVNQFFGIPYAASPPIRFSPPSDPPAWTTPLVAKSPKPACIQQFAYPEKTRNLAISLFSTPMPPESEDCLYINVYAPAKPPPSGGRAVMVWFYGGLLQFGTSTLPMYDGSNLAANQDVVIVSFNYRTNVFGFPNSPQQSQNLGFLDQRKALQWVRTNIAAFGGDPAKVTLFGESAGGYSVKQLIAKPPNPLPFRAAIIQSPGAQLVGGVESWNALVSAVNCKSASSQIDCVRKVPATTIKDIIEKAPLLFPPVFDDVTAVRDVTKSFTSRTAAKVPLLIGTNADEGTIFAAGTTDMNAFVAQNFPGQPALQQAILKAYPTSAYGSPFQTAAAVLRDFLFQCPASSLSNLTANSGSNTWRYYFNTTLPNLQTPLLPGAGVYHSIEIPEIFATYPKDGATYQQMGISNFMQIYWGNFAKSLDPGQGWGKLNPTPQWAWDVQAIGSYGAHNGYPVSREALDTMCAFWAPILALSGN